MSRHKPIPKKMRLLLYEKYNHKCAYCGCDLQNQPMHSRNYCKKEDGILPRLRSEIRLE